MTECTVNAHTRTFSPLMRQSRCAVGCDGAEVQVRSTVSLTAYVGALPVTRGARRGGSVGKGYPIRMAINYYNLQFCFL